MSREAENKKKKDIRPKTIEQSTVGSLCSCPIQEGFTDCGVFLLHFVEKFLQDPSLAIAHAVNPFLTSLFSITHAALRLGH